MKTSGSESGRMNDSPTGAGLVEGATTSICLRLPSKTGRLRSPSTASKLILSSYGNILKKCLCCVRFISWTCSL